MDAKIHIYRDDGERSYCNMSLPSGERILISLSAEGLLVSKLALFGVIPIATIIRIDREDTVALIQQLMPDKARFWEDRPLKLIAGLCAGSADIQQLRDKLTKLLGDRIPASR